MDLNILRKYCLNKRGATENFPFDERTLVFKVGSKIFAITDIKSPVFYISLKCDPYMAQDLRYSYSCIKPGYHLNKKHWNTVEIDGTLEDEQIFYLIDHSYDLVYKGLKKSEKDVLSKCKKL